jgi:hypothetical protein
MFTIAPARERTPTPHARFSPTRGALTPDRRMRVVNAPWKNWPVRIIVAEWPRAARSSRESRHRARSPCATRAWFMTLRMANSERVSVPASALPPIVTAAAAAAASVSTRLATSACM